VSFSVESSIPAASESKERRLPANRIILLWFSVFKKSTTVIFEQESVKLVKYFSTFDVQNFIVFKSNCRTRMSSLDAIYVAPDLRGILWLDRSQSEEDPLPIKVKVLLIFEQEVHSQYRQNG
jgi:hypothetical protein